jgi:hypothetical protein
VPDARNVLNVDILELALELSGRRDRLAVAIGYVEIYVASHAPRELGAKHRIQANCQLNRSAKLIQLGDHIRQRGRARGMPDQDDSLDFSTSVPDGGFVGERRPGGEVRDGDRNALRPQLCRDVIETQRKDIEHAAQQVDMSRRSSRRGVPRLCGACADRQEQQDRDRHRVQPTPRCPGKKR